MAPFGTMILIFSRALIPRQPGPPLLNLAALARLTSASTETAGVPACSGTSAGLGQYHYRCLARS